MKNRLFLLPLATITFAAKAYTIDWEQIEYWTGEGDQKAALVVQFDCPGQTNPGAIVWGYRWTDGDNPTGYSMLCDIAANSPDLAVLVQHTGSMGATLDGIGFASDIADVLEHLGYDLDGASEDSRISFGFFSPNTAMGQTSAPGSETINLIYEAIADAVETHVILHPLDVNNFGYPAYDYDWWILDRTATVNPAESYWNSGWYDGYWGYWTGTTDLNALGYSGLGMSSVELADGDVHAWKFSPLTDENVDGYTGASTPWLAPNYSHKINFSGIEIPDSDTHDTPARYYRLDGIEVSPGALTPGIYIIRNGNKTSKQIIL